VKKHGRDECKQQRPPNSGNSGLPYPELLGLQTLPKFRDCHRRNKKQVEITDQIIDRRQLTANSTSLQLFLLARLLLSHASKLPLFLCRGRVDYVILLLWSPWLLLLPQ
jgi:hypothetical protein